LVGKFPGSKKLNYLEFRKIARFLMKAVTFDSELSNQEAGK